MDDDFDAERIAADLMAWAEIESPSTEPDAVNRMMDHAAGAMTALGAAVERFPGGAGVGDVLRARFDWGEGPGILVLGHLDTVHLLGTTSGALPIRRDGDRLYGPGVLDMKGGMVLALHALERIIAARGRLTLPVTVLFIPDEELGSPATRAVIEREARANKCVLVPEPGRRTRFVTGRHAVLRFNLRTHGRPSHAAKPGGAGRSAISAMARLVAEIEGLSDADRQISYRVGKIQGGTFVNVVASECRAEVLCVAATQADVEEVDARMRALQSPDPEVRLEVEPGPVRPLFQAGAGGRELYELARRVAREIGLDMGEGQFGGGSDGNFTGALGIPTLDGLGPCGDGVHTKNEHVLVSSLVPRARLLAGLFAALSDSNR